MPVEKGIPTGFRTLLLLYDLRWVFLFFFFIFALCSDLDFSIYIPFSLLSSFFFFSKRHIAPHVNSTHHYSFLFCFFFALNHQSNVAITVFSSREIQFCLRHRCTTRQVKLRPDHDHDQSYLLPCPPPSFRFGYN